MDCKGTETWKGDSEMIICNRCKVQMEHHRNPINRNQYDTKVDVCNDCEDDFVKMFHRWVKRGIRK